MADYPGIAFCKGRYMPVGEASIAVLDPAFTKSDVVFDAVSFINGAFFRLDDHLARFRDSCAYVRLKSPFSDEEMTRIMVQCAVRSGLDDGMVFVLCTRGRYTGGVQFGDPRRCENEFIAYSVPYFWIVPKDRAQTGCHIWIPEVRRAPDISINQRAKNFNRMDLTRGQFEALDAGADAPVLLSIDGYLTEGPGFNIWLIKNGKALTPGDNLLEGVTRRTVFDLCQSIGLPAETANLTAEDFAAADEAFISSTGGGVIPVTRVNERTIANGAPGLATCQLRDLYWIKRQEGWRSTPFERYLEPPVHQAASAE
jgi:branched-chain amino acid aminotransferase